jgi:hypothetical protein
MQLNQVGKVILLVYADNTIESGRKDCLVLI